MLTEESSQHRVPMSSASDEVQIYTVGSTAVIKFTGSNVPGDSHIIDHRDLLMELASTRKPDVMIFDLSTIPAISSSSIGLLFSLFKMGIKVQFFEPSPTTRDVMAVTQLQEIFPEVESLPEPDSGEND